MNKKICLFAAGLVLCAVLTACGGEKAEAETENIPPVQSEKTEVNFDEIFEGLVPHEGNTSDDGVPEERFVELIEACEDGAYDDMCSYGISYPQTEDADYQALNALFLEDAGELKAEISGEIFNTAADRSCIALVNGWYEEYQDGSSLCVDYTLSIKYSDSESENHKTYSVQYDLASCTRTEASW